MSEEDKIREGEKAKHLLSDPSLISVLSDMSKFWHYEIMTSKAREVKKREECYRMLKCIEQFEKTLKRRIDTGKVAENTLKQKVVDNVQRLFRSQY